MDLAFAWCDAMGVPREMIRHLHAYEVWTKPLDSAPQYFDYIPNTPSGFPKEGDLVVFNQGVGPSGHIRIATDKATASAFTSFDQNWNGVTSAQLVEHTYEHVYGWLHKKQPERNHALSAALFTAEHTIVEKEQEIAAIKSQLGALKGKPIDENSAPVITPSMLIPLVKNLRNVLKGKKTIIIGVLLIIIGYLQNDSRIVLEGVGVIGLHISFLNSQILSLLKGK